DVPIAITGAEITSLRSVQLKGRLRRLSSGGATDMVRARRYCDAFVAAVGAADGLPAELMERWMPDAVAVADVDVEEVYDQTPGPDAGGLLSRTAP
ncbi:MAG TPA: hypothetical protein VHK88_06455, partial [Aquihabitans sp.]|nr:hypothetical protein [Aquihabitans sp.]